MNKLRQSLLFFLLAISIFNAAYAEKISYEQKVYYANKPLPKIAAEIREQNPGISDEEIASKLKNDLAIVTPEFAKKKFGLIWKDNNLPKSFLEKHVSEHEEHHSKPYDFFANESFYPTVVICDMESDVGYGLFSLDRISKGQLVAEYAGGGMLNVKGLTIAMYIIQDYSKKSLYDTQNMKFFADSLNNFHAAMNNGIITRDQATRDLVKYDGYDSNDHNKTKEIEEIIARFKHAIDEGSKIEMEYIDFRNVDISYLYGGDQYCRIDAKYAGNASRFILSILGKNEAGVWGTNALNSFKEISSKHTLAKKNVVFGGVHTIYMYAVKDIELFEQIVTDYAKAYWENWRQKNSEKIPFVFGIDGSSFPLLPKENVNDEAGMEL